MTSFASTNISVMLFLAFVLVCQLGCGPAGPKLVPVQGKVLSNGQPVTAGSITFHPAPENEFQDDKPSSLLQLDGSFTMKTFPFGEGVTPGNFRVTLTPELAQRLKKPEYASPVETPWQVTVPENGMSELLLEVH